MNKTECRKLSKANGDSGVHGMMPYKDHECGMARDTPLHYLHKMLYLGLAAIWNKSDEMG